MRLDLNGIAKGYGVDRLAESPRALGIDGALVSIDGELRALGLLPDGSPWPVAVEAPRLRTRRAPQAVLQAADCAVATSGDYRHWVEVGPHAAVAHDGSAPRRAAGRTAGLGHGGRANAACWPTPSPPR